MDQARDPHYAASGVNSTKAETGLDRLRALADLTFPFNPSARPHLPLDIFPISFVSMILTPALPLLRLESGPSFLLPSSWKNATRLALNILP